MLVQEQLLLTINKTVQILFFSPNADTEIVVALPPLFVAHWVLQDCLLPFGQFVRLSLSELGVLDSHDPAFSFLWHCLLLS